MHSEACESYRAKFDAYMKKEPSMLPDSFVDAVWNESKQMKKGCEFFNNEKQKKLHLSHPKKYQFYDASF